MNKLDYSIVGGLNHIWSSFFLPIFGNYGESTWPFAVQWEQLEDSWFGPLGLTLFIGFIIGLYLEKNSDQKYLYLFSILILLMICNQLAWRPFNDRYFSLFFILLATMHARNSRLNSTPVIRYICLAISLILFNWAVFFNQNLPTINFLSLNLKAVWDDISENSVLIRTNFGRTKLGYPQIPREVINNIEENARISIWSEGYMPLASITRQVFDRKLKPLRYTVLDDYMVNEFSELPLDQVFKSDYLLQLGSENALTVDKNTFKTVWEHKISQKLTWSLSKIIKTNT